MTHVVTAEFVDRRKAASAVHALKAHHYPANEISVIEHAIEQHMSYGATYKDPELHPRNSPGLWGGTARGIGAGACAGLVAMAFIPTLILALPFFVAGGGLVGALVGGMGGLGIAQRHKNPDEARRTGGALIVVRDEDPDRAQEALEVLRETGALSLGVSRQDVHA
jgi:hypothetical protein